MAHRTPRFYLKIVMVILAFFIIAGYSYFRARDMINGPEITILEPKNGTDFESPDINLTGVAKNVTFLTLNGRQIYTDSTGNFSRKLLLSRGYNIITLVARDKFNKIVDKSLQLTYGQNAATTDKDNVTSSTSPL